MSKTQEELLLAASFKGGVKAEKKAIGRPYSSPINSESNYASPSAPVSSPSSNSSQSRLPDAQNPPHSSMYSVNLDSRSSISPEEYTPPAQAGSFSGIVNSGPKSAKSFSKTVGPNPSPNSSPDSEEEMKAPPKGRAGAAIHKAALKAAGEAAPNAKFLAALKAAREERDRDASKASTPIPPPKPTKKLTGIAAAIEASIAERKGAKERGYSTKEITKAMGEFIKDTGTKMAQSQSPKEVIEAAEVAAMFVEAAANPTPSVTANSAEKKTGKNNLRDLLESAPASPAQSNSLRGGAISTSRASSPSSQDGAPSYDEYGPIPPRKPRSQSRGM